MTSILRYVKDDINIYIFLNGRRSHFLRKLKTTSIFGNLRQPQFKGKWKTSSILTLIEDDLNFNINGRQSQ